MEKEEISTIVRQVLKDVLTKQDALDVKALHSSDTSDTKTKFTRALADQNIARWLGRPLQKSQNKKEIPEHNVPKPRKPEALNALLGRSPARLGVWRAGTRYLTRVALKLRADHAVAKDAVYAEMPADYAEKNGWVPLETKAKNKEEFLLRPDLGRQLDEKSLQTVKEKAIQKPDIQITVADGLSFWAADRNAKPLVEELSRLCKESNLTVGTIFCVKYSRIAIQDVIGELVGARISLILLGERPGLGGGDSLSSYMVYAPKVGTVNAKKSMISNIHPLGHKPLDAARLTLEMIKKMLEQKCSGVELRI